MWQLLLPAITGIIDKIIPDAKAAADAKLRALELAQAGQLAELESVKALALAQMEVNKAEAQSGNAFAGGWRPLVGYVCAAALAWDTILKPMLVTGMAFAGHPAPALPDLSSEQLYSLLFGLLGLGSLRTVEKVKGAA